MNAPTPPRCGRITLWTEAGEKITLGDADFVARGGEGSVYARGERGFKIFHDPAAACSAEKIAELGAIAHPDVLVPSGLLFRRRGRGRQRLGHEFRFIVDAWSACELIPVAFRRRHALDPDVIPAIVTSIRDRVWAVHAGGCLVVDLNELNVLVTKDFSRTVLIDTDSFQTPSFPASAIMASVMDPSRALGDFDAGTDWFAFAVVAFSLFTGIHPYRGKHPDVRGLTARMAQGITVFDPQVRTPRACLGVDTIPTGWRDWLRAVLVDGERDAPPKTMALGPTPSRSRGLGPARSAVDVLTLGAFSGRVRAVLETARHQIVHAGKAVLLDGAEVIPMPHHCSLGTSRSGRPLAAWIDAGALRIVALDRCVPVPVSLHARSITSAGGCLFALTDTGIVRADVIDLGDQLVATVVPAAATLSRHARAWPGVVVQSPLGSAWACLLHRTGEAEPRRVPELDDTQVIDAIHHRGVLVVLTVRDGRYDRWVFRFARANYDVRHDEDVTPVGASLVTLSRGVSVSSNADEAIEIFPAAPGSSGRRTLSDPVLGEDGRLLAGFDRVLAARGHELLAIRMRAG